MAISYWMVGGSQLLFPYFSHLPFCRVIHESVQNEQRKIQLQDRRSQDKIPPFSFTRFGLGMKWAAIKDEDNEEINMEIKIKHKRI